MKMFNHLKHLTLNKVYLTYVGIPQESFEVAQNPRQTRDKSGKQVWRNRYPKRVFVNSTNIPFFFFFWFWPFWHPKRVTRVTHHYWQEVPFLRVFMVARVYSHIVEWPPREYAPPHHSAQVVNLSYCIRYIFRESNFSRIGTSRHFREWLNSRSRSTNIAYTSRIHASGSEVNIFACC